MFNSWYDSKIWEKLLKNLVKSVKCVVNEIFIELIFVIYYLSNLVISYNLKIIDATNFKYSIHIKNTLVET